MKAHISLGVLLLVASTMLGQVSGNINYQNQVSFPDNTINVSLSASRDLTISVKGLNNLLADSYVAIFNVTQVGQTTEEVNRLMTERIDAVKKLTDPIPEVEFYVDMISFVPVYDYEVERKIFSKKTYNEIPKGFELKKNLHIQYKDPEVLNVLISILSNVEVYDLVRVDYFVDNIELRKKELMEKAHMLIKERIGNYEDLMAEDFSIWERDLSDGFKVVYPVEMYKQYQAYHSSALNLRRKAHVKNVEKSTTLYYQPVMDKEFDFVLNPTISEPVIQVMYEIKIRLRRNVVDVKPANKSGKEYIFITPSGDLKPIPLYP